MIMLRQRVASGESLAGTWLNLGSPFSAEIAALAGFDWVLIDREHGSGGETGMALQIMAAAAGGAAPIVRVGAIDRAEIKRALDAGASGIMAPCVDTPEQAEALVRAIRLAPVGDRGAAISTRASGYGFRYREYLDTANDGLLTIAQIESVTALEHCARIAAVDGVDVLFVGPTDLATSMRIPPSDERFAAALDLVAHTAAAAGKAAGILARTAADAERYRQLGYRFISLASDRGLLADGFRRAAEQLGAMRAR
jgi:4-hydroxy-2-oxoheptanedioate aldolase